jgi:hypothetical protein
MSVYTHLSQQQHGTEGAGQSVGEQSWLTKNCPPSWLQTVCAVWMHEAFAPGVQQAPKTCVEQFTFAQVVPTPKNPPPLGRHSHEYVETQLGPKQHAP